MNLEAKLKSTLLRFVLLSISFLCFINQTNAQDISVQNVTGQPGIIGTIVLAIVIITLAIIIFISRIVFIVRKVNEGKELKKWTYLSEQIFAKTRRELEALKYRREKSKKVEVEDVKFSSTLQSKTDKIEYLLDITESKNIDTLITERLSALEFKLKGDELGSEKIPNDSFGLIATSIKSPHSPLFDPKQTTEPILEEDSQLIKLVLGYLYTASFWLLFGTLIGLLLGVKFIIPDMDHLEILSFGRIRPVHTNAVFWGWSSLAMLGLGYYAVSKTCNTKIFNYRAGWISLILINLAVLIGSCCLMAGINNGGGEYREYTWPVMLLFAFGVFNNFMNYYKTIGTRKTEEIYVSNWYIIGASVWTLVMILIGYLPFYQEGLGETVIQGYYMHQGVGMWFMTFTLGLTYYYLPLSLNKPIYSYSLGILAFWTQMLFYTLIGTHHFVFSPLPWWLQTVAIVFSAGMFIPVLAGTTNFLMTMKGTFNMLGRSYVLPFFLVGVLYYFIGSVQGSFQAFRFTNFVWHFTDFNVAHSHMTMYGIISFLLWGAMYAILPKLTGREPNQLLVGVHFWLSFLGLIVYSVALMVGGTMKGLSWIEGEPFIKSVVLMVPYWVWRAIGGTFMFASHIIFWFNLHKVCKHYFIKQKAKIKVA